MKSVLLRAATSLSLIVVVALGTRLAFAWDQQREIPSQVLSQVPFQTETGHIAFSIASGKGFSSPFQRDTGPTAWLAPVYPYLLAGIFRIFGVYTLRSFFAAVLLNILFSAGACVPIFYAGKRIAGLGAARAAAWLWALFPNSIIIPFEWVWDTCLSALLVSVLLLATFKIAEARRLRDRCFYGLLWGFALLTNPAVALLFPVFVLWAALRIRNRGLNMAWITRPVLATGVALLCCVPWTVRNYIAFHSLIPIRSNFAFELYVGNNENYDEAHRFRPGAITQDREILRYFRLGESAFMQEEKKKALAFMVAHPRIELWLVSERMVDFWMGTATPLATFRQAELPWLRMILLCNFAAPLGALAGAIVLVLRKNKYAVPVISVPVVFPLLYYVTHTSLRYRHPIDPVVLLLVAIALNGLWQLFRSNRERVASDEIPAGDSSAG
ncbi:MAG TPA: glycosyltransferase family 39 protein [Candidatus Acidoferrum sp.]|nr:glycosyltransferase family 39 protein [Candidatus Acidoferrum sp.]